MWSKIKTLRNNHNGATAIQCKNLRPGSWVREEDAFLSKVKFKLKNILNKFFIEVLHGKIHRCYN